MAATLKDSAPFVAGKQPPVRFHAAETAVDAKAIRTGLKQSQTEFARRFRFPVATVREWEQGRRRPEQAARTLLLVIASKPEIVDEVLAASVSHKARARTTARTALSVLERDRFRLNCRDAAGLVQL